MTGKTQAWMLDGRALAVPQWSPVVMTGKTFNGQFVARDVAAAMEPRRDDGEDPGPDAPPWRRRWCRNGAPS